jgi:hypothetical protein
MSNRIIEWQFDIDGLLYDQVRLKRKVWLKKNEILLKKKGDKLIAYVLDDGTNSHKHGEKLAPYLWMFSLVSFRTPELRSRGGHSISSKDALGDDSILVTSSFNMRLPNDAVGEIESYAPDFLRFVRDLHDRYHDVVEENEFSRIALEFFYESERKSIRTSEGFINAVISLEALFNEGPSDIRYKLSHRAAFLLGLCGMDPEVTFEKLKDMYNMRSKIVHGGGSLSQDPERYVLAQYTRRALMIFLILLSKSKRRKERRKERKIKILKEVDYAMLDEGKRKSLKNEIDRGLGGFRLKIPSTFEGVEQGREYRFTAW